MIPDFIIQQITKSVDDPMRAFGSSVKAMKIEQYAQKRGWFSRLSVTQAQWTSKGIYEAGLWNERFHGIYIQKLS